MTHGYEFATAITNVFIVLSGLYAFLRLYKTKTDKKLKLFFFLIFIAGIFGTIIHGIVMTKLCKKILWMILSGIFGIVINLLLVIFLNFKYPKLGIKQALLLSIFVYVVMFIELLFNMDIIPTFTGYALLVILIMTYILFKKGIKNHIYYFLGILMQYIGGMFIIFRRFVHLPLLDHNGIYHLFMVFTIIFFYLESKKKLDTSKK